MFDRYIVPTKTEYVTRTVHEHRAPTDESVRLLREMESKAQEQVDRSVRLETNNLKAVLHFMREPLQLDYIYCIQIDLNGERHKVEIRADSFRSKEERMDMIIEELSKAIASKVLRDVSNELVRVI